jgi:hypothetical protein
MDYSTLKSKRCHQVWAKLHRISATCINDITNWYNNSQTIQCFGSDSLMQHRENCDVCGTALIYAPEDIPVKCSICGRESKAQIYCPNGHHVCPECRNLEVLEVLEKVISSTTSASPSEILERVMAHPKLTMHGANHHFIVPAVIVAAAKNAGYEVPVEALPQAIQRGLQVPGGW